MSRCVGDMMRAMASPRQESESLDVQVLVDSIPALIHTARPDGYLDYFNKPWLEYLGVTLDKVTGWNWTAFVHTEDIEGIVAKWRACLATGEVFEYETRVRSANGEYRWMLHRKVPLRDANGNIVKWYGSSLDIEERKTAEEQFRRNAQELQRSEFYLAEGQRLGHTGSWALNPSGFFEYWSRELFQIYGLDPQKGAPTLEQYLATIHPQDRDFMADTGEIVWSDETYRIFEYDAAEKPTVSMVLQRTHPQDRALVQQVIENVSKSGTDFEHEYRLVMQSGVMKHVHVRAHALRDSSGNIEFVGAVTDVSEQRHAEAVHREQKAELPHLLEFNPAMVWRSPPDGSDNFLQHPFGE